MDSCQQRSSGEWALLPDTRLFDIEGADGEIWRLFVHVPPGNSPPDGWPLLVMTDGNAMIATAVDTVRVQAAYPMGTDVQPGVIAAIGYPGDDAYDPLRRSFDLSPPPGRTYPPFAEGAPAVVTGGADRFLQFIEHEALAFVETRYVAASPTISWEDGLLLNSEKLFAASPELAPFQYEREDTAKRIAHARTIQTLALTQAMATRLANLPRISVVCETYPGETHMTMLPVAISRAVRVAFRLSA